MSNPYASPDSQNESSDLSELIAGDVRVLQVVTGALVQGAVVFAAIAFFISGLDVNKEPELLSWGGVGFASLMFIAHLIVPPVVCRKALRDMEPQAFRDVGLPERVKHVMGAVRTSHIMACAMLEGPAFLNLVAFMVMGWVGNLAVAGVLIVLILLKFPTTSKVSFRIQNLMQEMEI